MLDSIAQTLNDRRRTLPIIQFPAFIGDPFPGDEALFSQLHEGDGNILQGLP
jgi:hypothetical protein